MVIDAGLLQTQLLNSATGSATWAAATTIAVAVTVLGATSMVFSWRSKREAADGILPGRDVLILRCNWSRSTAATILTRLA